MYLNGQEHTLCSNQVQGFLNHQSAGYSAVVFDGAVYWMKLEEGKRTPQVGSVDLLTAKVVGDAPPKIQVACMYSAICPKADIALCD